MDLPMIETPATAPAVAPKWNTAQTRDALRARYSRTVMGTVNFALLFEVADSTGTANRYADAIGMNLWRSDGYFLHGFEIKTSRADWLNELKAPSKAHAFKRYMDRWWLVVGDASIVKPGELPAGWGLMQPAHTGKLYTQTAATPLSPEPIPRSFLAALLRRVVEQSVDQQIIEAAEARGKADGIREAAQLSDRVSRSIRQLTYVRDEAKTLLAQCSESLKAVGAMEKP